MTDRNMTADRASTLLSLLGDSLDDFDMARSMFLALDDAVRDGRDEFRDDRDDVLVIVTDLGCR